MGDVQRIVHDYKLDFVDRLTRTAADADAMHPAALGRQLAVLLEGATALAASLNDTAPLDDARERGFTLGESLYVRLDAIRCSNH